MSTLKWLMMLLLLTTDATAKCINVPICLPPYSPPVDGLVMYEDNIPMHEWASTCLPKVKSCLGWPFWAPAGGLRTTAWYCAANDNAVLSFTVTRAGVESTRSTVKLDDGTAGWPTKCWEKLTTPTQPLKVSDLKSPSEKLAGLGAVCLADPACTQLVMDSCLNVENCKTALAPKLQSDFNNDDTIDAQDAGWWLATLRRLIW